MSLKNIVTFSLLVSFILLLAACNEKNKEKEHVKKEIQKVTVDIHTIEKKTYPIWLDFTGKTEALENVYVTSRVTGELKEIFFKAGDVVKKGDKLFKIDDKEYRSILRQKQSKLEKDTSSLNLALINLKRYEPLVKKDLVPKEKLDEIQTSVDEYRAMVKADKSAISEAQLDVDYSTIRASIDGHIGKSLVDKGNIIKINDKLANIVQSKQLYVNFNPSSNGMFLINQYKSQKYPEVKVLPENIDDESLSLRGNIDFIDSVADKTTGTVLMRAKIDNTKDVLLPGTFVKIKMLITDKQAVLAVHPDNISQDQLGSYVFIVNDENKVKKAQIKIAYSNKDIAIVQSGLQVGDKVIVSATSQLKENQSVTPTEVADPVTLH